jgi:hypothetical protein
MCGMIAYPATISGANLILPGDPHGDRRGRAACDMDLATPRAGTFVRAGQ